ncbi:ParA family protein [Micromonospora sp. NPDC049645]|uniref:ParA family protein n=1 Tax=Micromonospora sp. NPDC049645 TaxID=3155508 RepID=UPI00341BD6A7
MRIVLLNNKGGVGKTMIAGGIAEDAARRGRRVLLVDMDPQANTTDRFGVRPEIASGRVDELHSLTRCLAPGVRNGDAGDYLYSCQWREEWAELIQVLPADLDLEDRAIEAGLPGAANRLRKALAGVDDDHDITIIDCAPSLKGHLTGMSLAALNGDADAVVVPLAAERYAITGALRSTAYVRATRDDFGVPHLDVAGLVVNSVRSGTNTHKVRYEQLVDQFAGLTGGPVRVLGDRIPLRARVAELQDLARPMLDDRDLGANPAGDPTGVVASIRTITDALLAREAVAA